MTKNSEILHFNKMAEEKGYAWWGSRTYSGKIRKHVRATTAKKYLGDFNNKIILEIGCASGDYTKVLSEVFPNNKILATDISPGQTKIARNRIKNKNIEFKVKDCENMNLGNQSIDYVIANSVLHHVNAEVCLKECYRVLKKSGSIFFTEPNMLNPQVFIEKKIPIIKKLAEDSPDEVAFYRWEIKKIVKSAGFKKVKVNNFDFLHPITPKIFTNIFKGISGILEKIPILKEISGSLIIYGQK